MNEDWVSAALHVAACVVIPFAWGVFVHWAFARIEGTAARRRGGRQASPARAAGPEPVSSLWDYQI